MPAVRAQLWPPGNTHEGYEVSQVPDWICRRRAKGSACRRHRSGEAWVRRGLGPSSPPGDAATGTLYARIGWDFATRRGPENGEENH